MDLTDALNKQNILISQLNKLVDNLQLQNDILTRKEVDSEKPQPQGSSPIFNKLMGYIK